MRRIGRVHNWELGRSGNLDVFLYRSIPMARGMLGNVIGRSESRAGPRLLHSPTRLLPDSAQGHRGAEGKPGTHPQEPIVLFRPIRGSYPFREPHPTADAVGYRLPVLRTSAPPSAPQLPLLPYSHSYSARRAVLVLEPQQTPTCEQTIAPSTSRSTSTTATRAHLNPSAPLRLCGGFLPTTPLSLRPGGPKDDSPRRQPWDRALRATSPGRGDRIHSTAANLSSSFATSGALSHS